MSYALEPWAINHKYVALNGLPWRWRQENPSKHMLLIYQIMCPRIQEYETLKNFHLHLRFWQRWQEANVSGEHRLHLLGGRVIKAKNQQKLRSACTWTSGLKFTLNMTQHIKCVNLGEVICYTYYEIAIYKFVTTTKSRMYTSSGISVSGDRVATSWSAHGTGCTGWAPEIGFQLE
jgi:hypothetical protein